MRHLRYQARALQLRPGLRLLALSLTSLIFARRALLLHRKAEACGAPQQPGADIH